VGLTVTLVYEVENYLNRNNTISNEIVNIQNTKKARREAANRTFDRMEANVMSEREKYSN
jgi:hypothetical protein